MQSQWRVRESHTGNYKRKRTTVDLCRRCGYAVQTRTQHTTAGVKSQRRWQLGDKGETRQQQPVVIWLEGEHAVSPG